MSEWINLEIKTQSNEHANTIANTARSYFEDAYEERFEFWGKCIEAQNNLVVNNAGTAMYHFDYEELNGWLFEEIAKDHPDISFDGTCECENDNGYSPNSFRKVYNSEILLEVEKTNKAKLIFCRKSYSGQYVMPDNIIQICDEAFQDCTALESVFVSKNVKKIGKNAFSGCSKLSEIHIPPTVEKITGKAVFKGCKELTIYAPAGSVAEAYAKANKIPFIAE